ncbi:murein biosynthesis integral membrane protein MurJ [Caloramator australicus]|uniref:Probable lipid II flippase MurJ n=1 Tax=Caloramator australicus RC3 TaxID=857293 RepID=I7LKA2_9CLOT|nr:murein biosynthesis integral membrane protein MurJ [Caloramator australicus]CCJ34303.1 Membrane protein involved in the export of O-antigen, teichoic acid lipoteichoic acids [Caloramator australicus RC3]
MNKKLLKGSIIIIIFTILSKLLGFLRETLLAFRFGASYDTDIYTFAIGLVMLIFGSIGSGIGTTFIPILTEFIEKKSKEDRVRFVNNVINIVGIIVIGFILFGIIFSKYIVMLFAPGFRGDLVVFNRAVAVSKMMFISMIFIAMQSIFTGILQSHKEFTAPAFVGVLMNVVIISYLALLAGKFGILGLTLATILANFVQFVFLVPKFKGLGYRYEFYFNFKDENILRMVKLMVPVIIGTSVSQVNFLVDRMLATTVGEGSIAVLNFANKLNMFVYGIFAVAITTVIYPTLSTYSAQENLKAYKDALIKGINVILLIMLPATMWMMVLRQPIVDIVFKRGAFDNNAAYLTSLALLFYSPGMIFVGVRDVIGRAFYSIKDTKTPMINGVVGVVLNIILNIVLVKIMGVSGLALATSISVIVVTLLLIRSLNRKIEDIGMKKLISSFNKMLLSSLVMGAVVFVLNKFLQLKFGTGFKGDVISVFGCAFVGALVYFGMIHIFKLEEYVYFVNIVKKKLKKAA